MPKEEWWVEGALFEGKENSYIFTNVKVTDRWENSQIGADVIGYLIEPETICEYTRKIDVRRKKIWEGDILKDANGRLCAVKWDDFVSGFICWDDEILGYKCRRACTEIVGNIFDNPELLKGGTAE